LLGEYLSQYGVTIEPFEQLRPWVVVALITLFEIQKAGYEAEFGVDQAFIDRAVDEKPIRGLETFESQIQVLSSLDESLQDLMLKDMLVRTEEIEVQATDLLDAWERGEEDTLVEAFFGALEKHPELEPFYDALFFERNETMGRQLIDLAKDGQTRFVVLGVAHMVGARGIPAFLATHGFDVQRIEAADTVRASTGVRR
jgi:uncharacterized protein YbaP (TraB family)